MTSDFKIQKLTSAHVNHSIDSKGVSRVVMSERACAMTFSRAELLPAFNASAFSLRAFNMGAISSERAIRTRVDSNEIGNDENSLP